MDIYVFTIIGFHLPGMEQAIVWSTDRYIMHVFIRNTLGLLSDQIDNAMERVQMYHIESTDDIAQVKKEHGIYAGNRLFLIGGCDEFDRALVKYQIALTQEIESEFLSGVSRMEVGSQLLYYIISVSYIAKYLNDEYREPVIDFMKFLLWYVHLYCAITCGQTDIQGADPNQVDRLLADLYMLRDREETKRIVLGDWDSRSKEIRHREICTMDIDNVPYRFKLVNEVLPPWSQRKEMNQWNESFYRKGIC